MSVIGIVSMKGGVGKTSTTANLATALAAILGAGRVSVLDLDPQNGLHWHFGLCDSHLPGACEESLEKGDWQAIAHTSEFGVSCLPYGNVSEADREDFETLLAQQPNWVGDQLDRAGLDQNALVLIDTPPGPSVYLKQVFACADLILVVLLADAGSYATIPAMETWRGEMAETRPGLSVYYVLNQVDRREILNRDTAALLHQQLKQCIAPVDIHADDTVGEALAFQQPVVVYAPQGKASQDLKKLAAWVIDTLNQ